MIKIKQVLFAAALLLIVPATAYSIGANQVIADIVSGLQVQVGGVKAEPATILKQSGKEYVPVVETFESLGYTVSKESGNYKLTLDGTAYPSISRNKDIIIENIEVKAEAYKNYENKPVGKINVIFSINVTSELKKSPTAKLEIFNPHKKVIATNTGVLEDKSVGQRSYTMTSFDFYLPFNITTEAEASQKLADTYKARITLK